MPIDVTSAFQGISTPLPELYTKIGDLGWSVKKVHWDKKQDCFVAVARSPHGEEVEKTGNTDKTAVANLLIAVTRKNHMRTTAQWKVGMWKTQFTDQLKPIAEAYAQAPTYEPQAAQAFKELADDSVKRAAVLNKQLKIEVTDNPEPYANAQEMAEDIHKHKHFVVSRANSEHPIWTPEQNVAFRTVHDVLGHAVSGGDFGWEGENKACAAHFPLLSANAQKALFTECFTAETLIRTTTGYRPISEIKAGEYVLSGDGSFQKVKQIFEREHIGEILEITTASSLGSIRVTKEHPFKALVGQHQRKSKKLPCSRTNCHKYPEAHQFEWIEAGKLVEGGYLQTITSVENMDIASVGTRVEMRPGARVAARKDPPTLIVDDEFLWVVGMYLAEGSAGSGTLSFGLHKDETNCLDRLKTWFEARGYGTATRYQPGNGVEFTVNSTTLAEWWPKWLGRGSHNKSIPPILLNLPAERLRPLVEGVMDGDGHYPRNTLAQTSPLLALQITEISLRQGGQPTLQTYPKKGKKTVYDVNEASAHHKIDRRRGRRGHWTIPDGNGVRITNIETVPFEGKVYDLEVEGNHTFVVQNLIVHNCIAQTGYAAYYRAFGPQKVALFPQFTEPAQSAEGVGPAAQGVHPSQTTPPVSMPGLPQSPGVGLPKDNVPPHEYQNFGVGNMFQTEPNGYFPSTGIHVGGVEWNTDPNAGWSSGVQPMSPNAYLDHGDPLQAQSTIDNASLIDTEWAQLKTGEGGADYARMKQAIVNAFRAVLLSPRKDLRWNTIHYQDLQDVPSEVTDPAAYWNTLENKRQAWNVARFGEGERFAHMPYAKFVKPFESIIFQMNPHAGFKGAQERAKDLLFDWQTEEQNKVMREDRDKKQQRSSDEVERRANAQLAKRLQTYIKEFQPQLDFASRVSQDQLFDAPQEDPQTPRAGRYGAWMGTHLKAISQISQHVDDILKASLEDVHNHDGTGHHFRAAVLAMGVPGVGPKVCSFAWLLLQPLTSQLATIDVHMMAVLGHNYDKEMNNRDYFKFERELGAGRDAAGYSHVPLGAFQWGMWDNRCTGEGSHQDHSGLKVLDPLPHESIDWAAKANPSGHGEGAALPDWWENTKPFRDQVGEHWDQNIAPNYPQNQVPYGEYVPTTAKIAAVVRTPWFTHPQTGEHLQGEPGQTIMQHATQTLHVNTPEVWEQLQENAGKA